MNGICAVCLVFGRKLYNVSEVPQYLEFYKLILNDSILKDWQLMLCWECRAILRKCVLFKKKALSAKLTLQNANCIQEIETLPEVRSNKSCLQIFHVSRINLPDDDLKNETNSVYNEPNAVKNEPKDNEVPLEFVDHLNDVDSIETNTLLNPISYQHSNVTIDVKVEPGDEHTEPLTFADDFKLCDDSVKLKKDVSKNNGLQNTKKKKGKKSKVSKKKKRNIDVESDIDTNYYLDNIDNDIEDVPVNDDSKGDNQDDEFDVDNKEDCIKLIMLNDEEIIAEREEMKLSDAYVNSHFKCELCIIGFRSWINLTTHKDACHSESLGPHQCSTCSTRFQDPVSLSTHSAIHRRRYKCSICDVKFEQHDKAIAHGEAHQSVKCELCDCVSSSSYHHQWHMSTVHNEKPKCNECNKVFSSKKTYRYHMNVLHKGQNRFPCPQCGKIYQWKSNLSRHLKNHKARATGELYCSECDKKFSSVATYRQHILQAKRHVSTDQYSFSCSECNEKFLSKAKLRDHVQWVHLQKPQHVCPLCSKPFKSSTSLYVHVQYVHRGGQSLENLCHVCGKSYRSLAKLRSHEVAVHGDSSYHCTQCAATFRWYSSLYRHSREVHRHIKPVKKTKAVKKSTETMQANPTT